IRHYQPTGSYFFYAGLFFALAGCIDHATAVFFIGFAIYLFLIKPAERKYLVYYFIPVFITVLPVLIINFVISGQFLPFQLVPRFFDYEGSTWTKGKGITGSEINDFSFMLDYGFEMLFGQRGFIIYNPLLLIGIPCLVMEIAKGRTYKPEAIVTGVCSLVIMLYYIATSHNYSGGSYSIRWFIPLLPFLMFFIFRYLETHYAAKYRHPLVPVIILSCLISLVGLIDPWASKRYTEHSFLANIMTVIDDQGN
ncbi:MAG TPA: hypothetical protein VJ963_02245, partial [Bacteroidales bacterium]|nr:hypothetical protein [Bacteroidales bacterium]